MEWFFLGFQNFVKISNMRKKRIIYFTNQKFDYVLQNRAYQYVSIDCNDFWLSLNNSGIKINATPYFV